jgi:hypothetical protein
MVMAERPLSKRQDLARGSKNSELILGLPVRSMQYRDRLIRLALSANEPMILVGSSSTRGPTKVSFGSFASYREHSYFRYDLHFGHIPASHSVTRQAHR